MDCLRRSKTKSRGFSLVEMLLVLVIVSIISGVSFVVYSGFRSRSNLETATNSVVEALRHAQVNAEQVNGGSPWGLAVQPNQLVVFKGVSYAARTVAADQILPLPGGVTVNGSAEVVFAMVTGDTSAAGSITLSNGSNDKIISFNEKGVVTY